MAVAALALAPAASAATLQVAPGKACYSSGESINLLGTDFTPEGSANITRDGTSIGPAATDASGAFNGRLRLFHDRGTDTRTYTATDGTDPSLTASAQITVSAVRVRLTPATGGAGRRLRISASGFTTGKTLWVHVVRGRSRKHMKVGRLSGRCGRLDARRRLLRRNTRLGTYRIQFDTFRRYRATRPVKDVYTITVRPAGR